MVYVHTYYEGAKQTGESGRRALSSVCVCVLEKTWKERQTANICREKYEIATHTHTCPPPLSLSAVVISFSHHPTNNGEGALASTHSIREATMMETHTHTNTLN